MHHYIVLKFQNVYISDSKVSKTFITYSYSIVQHAHDTCEFSCMKLFDVQSGGSFAFNYLSFSQMGYSLFKLYSFKFNFNKGMFQKYFLLIKLYEQINYSKHRQTASKVVGFFFFSFFHFISYSQCL